MTDQTVSPPSPIPEIRLIDRRDIGAALRLGLADFLAAPWYGLFFAGFYVAGGLALYFGLFATGQAFWFVMIAAGFPLFAPFAAVGLYEVSRRREAGEPLSWGPVLGALRGHGDGQLPVMGVVVLLAFGFWVILARGIFAIFFSHSGIGLDNLGVLLSGAGVGMVLIGTIIGALLALALFSLTVVSLPLLLHREVDFVTAMICSLQSVQANPRTMLSWALLIAALLFLSMLPLFLGLLIALPVLGHASWHLYRRVLPDDEDR